MKITKLPNDWDPALMIQNRSREKYSVCPVCGESRPYSDEEYLRKIKAGEHISAEEALHGGHGVERRSLWPCSKGYYGPAKGDWLGWLVPSHYHNWRIDSYRCYTCGAEWESDPYPTDIKGV